MHYTMAEQILILQHDMKGSFSFRQKDDTSRKTPLGDNCWAKLVLTGQPGIAWLSFVDSDDNALHVPDLFFVDDITDGEERRIHIEHEPISHKFALLWARSYAFTYEGKNGKFVNQTQWAMIGEFVWE